MTESDAGAEASSRRSAAGWPLAAGLMLILAGLVAMLQPFLAGLLTVAMAGGAIAAGGLFALAAGLARGGGADRWLQILLGLAALALGILVFLHPLVAAVTLVALTAAALVAGGLVQLAAGLVGRRPWLVLLGVVDAALGALLLVVVDPWSAIFFLAVAVGFTLAAHGAVLIALAVRLRRLDVA